LSTCRSFSIGERKLRVQFVAVDVSKASDLTGCIWAHIALREREMISRRTKEALAVAKAQGVKLGNPNGAESFRRAGKGGAALRAAVLANAAVFAADLAPVLADIRAAVNTSRRAIATELTARGIRTRRGGRWGVGNVRWLLLRLNG
jgi:DNA invertase Pin-like site-specific DNA recombinase